MGRPLVIRPEKKISVVLAVLACEVSVSRKLLARRRSASSRSTGGSRLRGGRQGWTDRWPGWPVDAGATDAGRGR